MRKAVVIAHNGNPDYSFYVPIVNWLWRKLGWEVIITDISREIEFKELKEYRTETISQCVRLYAANYYPFYDYILVSDADMIPLSNYWNPDFKDITSYGRDLTDYHFPMAYIGMNVDNWCKVMELTGRTDLDMKRDLLAHPKSLSD